MEQLLAMLAAAARGQGEGSSSRGQRPRWLKGSQPTNRSIEKLEEDFTTAEKEACQGGESGSQKAMSLLGDIIDSPRSFFYYHLVVPDQEDYYTMQNSGVSPPTEVRRERTDVELGDEEKTSLLKRHVSLLESAYLLRGKIAMGVAHSVRAMTAGQHDERPVSRSDHVTLSSMAYADADTVLHYLNPTSHEALALRCDAAEAGMPYKLRSATLAALQRFPTDDRFLELATKYVDTTLAVATKIPEQLPADTPEPGPQDALEANVPELECPLCFHIFDEPVTASCGHTFCRQCLSSALDYSTTEGTSQQACPMCRTPLHLDVMSFPCTTVLERLIDSYYPKLKKARQLLKKQVDRIDGIEKTVSLPLFNVGLMMPGWVYHFRVFEPRYRLLFRRIMAGSRIFGSLDLSEMEEWKKNEDKLKDISKSGGDESKNLLLTIKLRVLDISTLSDGSLQISAEAMSRVQVKSMSEQDGYHVAHGIAYNDFKNKALVEALCPKAVSQKEEGGSQSSTSLAAKETLQTAFQLWGKIVAKHNLNSTGVLQQLGRMLGGGAVTFPVVIDPFATSEAGSTVCDSAKLLRSLQSLELASIWASRLFVKTESLHDKVIQLQSSPGRVSLLAEATGVSIDKDEDAAHESEPQSTEES